VVVSGGDPTDQRIVPFEVRWSDCGCTAINSALEPEQFERFCHSWYQSCRFTFTSEKALKKYFLDKSLPTNEFTKYVGSVKVGD
jgi:hypothetical protein